MRAFVRILFALLATSVLLASTPTAAASREVIDAARRTILVPERAERTFGTAPPSTLLIEVVAPGALVAVNVPGNSPFYASSPTGLSARFRALPAIGGWHGAARGANLEALLTLDPEIVIAWRNDYVMEPVLRSFARFGIPVVFVDEDLVSDEPGALRIVGQALGRAEAGERLGADAAARLDAVRALVAAVPEAERPVVYYAEGTDGLSTEFEASFHNDPFRVVGARSPFPGTQTSMAGQERVSLEEVMRVNPAVIVADNAEFAAAVRTDPRWADIAAVRAGRVYLVPKDPLSFLDRPPSVLRVLGVQWLASVLYPERYRGDIVQETITFFRDYLHTTIGEEEAREILGR